MDAPNLILEDADISRNLAIKIEFDGSNYNGWQRQLNAPSIQETLETCLSKITHEKITLIGCSRTDAGVHAQGHVSNFKTTCRIPIDKLPLALNTLLPPDIACQAAVEVSGNFNARFMACGKQYSYYINNAPTRSALRSRFSYHEARPLDIRLMKAAAKLIEGEHDFRCFMASGGQTKTTVRTIYRLDVVSEGDFCRLIVHGNGFLYNMVRIIAGTLLYVGLHKFSLDDLSLILAGRDRRLAGKTLAPQGLVLDRVFYAPEIFKNAVSVPRSAAVDTD